MNFTATVTSYDDFNDNYQLTVIETTTECAFNVAVRFYADTSGKQAMIAIVQNASTAIELLPVQNELHLLGLCSVAVQAAIDEYING